MDHIIKGKAWEQLFFTSLFDLGFKPEFDLTVRWLGFFFHIKTYFVGKSRLKL